MVKTAPWLKDLRGTIKRTYGPGWVLEERSGCFKIQRREAGNAREGKRPTITTKIRFAPSSSTEVLVLIGELKRKMADLGLGLYAAHTLISGVAEQSVMKVFCNCFVSICYEIVLQLLCSNLL